MAPGDLGPPGFSQAAGRLGARVFHQGFVVQRYGRHHVADFELDAVHLESYAVLLVGLLLAGEEKTP